jgi:hypothetical protein
MKLTPTQVQLLRHIRELPRASRITSGSAPSGCTELEAAGYIRIVPVNVSDLLTEITDEGRKVLVDLEENEGPSATNA